MKRRVVITGLGAITPIGNCIKEFWESIKKGIVGIGKITTFDCSEYRVKLAAEVKNFNPKNYMDAKSARRMERFSQFAVAAAKEAITDSGLDMTKEDPYRVGVSVGTGVGSMQIVEREYVKLTTKGPNRVNPLLVPMMIPNMAAGNIAIQFGLKGKNIDVTTACATGSHSIGEAFRTIQYGDADVMLAGGTEACLCAFGMVGFTALQALNPTEDPLRASIPFDKERNGFVMGEGSGVLVLEELEHAKARGAHIYAEMAGYGATSDAHHITAPAEDGEGASKAMEFAMRDAEVDPSEVDYINAHGTGTQLNDLCETKAIKLALGKHAQDVKINSTKSMVGHMIGAAGAVELITCVKSIEEGYIHQTMGYKVPDEECDLNYMTDGGLQTDVNVAMSNSFGFGGQNASLIVKKYAA